jgi:hypothetical protein
MRREPQEALVFYSRTKHSLPVEQHFDNAPAQDGILFIKEEDQFRRYGATKAVQE